MCVSSGSLQPGSQQAMGPTKGDETTSVCDSVTSDVTCRTGASDCQHELCSGKHKHTLLNARYESVSSAAGGGVELELL